MKLQENMTFDSHYTLQRQLGRGGFSEVWLAHDSYMDLDVAIKIYAPGQGMDEHSINEFRHEIKEVFHLNHSHLLKPQHLGIWENMPYLIMAYCPAGSCEKRVGTMTEPELWKLIRDVAAGLTYLHEKDVIHQDIKPDNILIDTEGNYLITDFGISTRARSTLQKSVVGSSILQGSGTVAYMGPERFSQQPAPTKASDIWSLGATLFELIEGTTPFPREVGGGMQKMGAEIPSINAPISDALKFTIFKMLSKETWDRPTAATLVEWATKPDAIQVDYTVFNKKVTTNSTDDTIPVKKNKSCVGYVIAIVILVLTTIVISVLYVDAQWRLSEKESLLSSIANNNIPLIITDIQMGNLYENSQIETDYGSEIYSKNTMYIAPSINYIGLKSGSETLKVKFFNSQGTLSTGTTSPAGYSYSNDNYIYNGKNTMTLSGWGSKNKGHWSAGNYRIEIWYKDKCLSSKSFTIY